jgi:hypothetical protein
MSGPNPSPSALAALTALMDPNLSKSAQAHLLSAAAQQQSPFLLPNDMKTDNEHD